MFVAVLYIYLMLNIVVWLLVGDLKGTDQGGLEEGVKFINSFLAESSTGSSRLPQHHRCMLRFYGHCKFPCTPWPAW